MSTTTRCDYDIRREVQQELDWDPRVDATAINVLVNDGIVRLVGAVATSARKSAACAAARRIAGVRGVVDELDLEIPRRATTDEEIVCAVRHALASDVYVPKERIACSVHDAWVTLDGEVDSRRQRDETLRAVERLDGVRGVTCRIAFPAHGPDARCAPSSRHG